MEDIRLFSLPPSYRRLDGVSDDFRGLNDSTDSESLAHGTRGEPSALASAEEEEPHDSAPGILAQFVATDRQLDKERFLGDWFTTMGVVPVTEVLGTGGSSSKNKNSTSTGVQPTGYDIT